MIRGTTAQFKFKIPYPKKELLWARIKFWQPGNPIDSLPITKELSNCTASEDSEELCISLTTEETLRFSDKFKAKVQLRAQHEHGTVFASHQQSITVYPILDDMTVEDPELPGANEDGWIILDGDKIALI